MMRVIVAGGECPRRSSRRGVNKVSSLMRRILGDNTPLRRINSRSALVRMGWSSCWRMIHGKSSIIILLIHLCNIILIDNSDKPIIQFLNPHPRHNTYNICSALGRWWIRCSTQTASYVSRGALLNLASINENNHLFLMDHSSQFWKSIYLYLNTVSKNAQFISSNCALF